VHLLDKDSIGSFRIRVSYPFALIAAGMKILVTGFGSQAKKKRAAFLARASTLYSFLYEDIALLLRENWVPRMKKYEFRLSAATGCFRHGVHTSIVVKKDRGPHDSFLQPNRVHRHVERVITIFLCIWTVFIRRHLGGQPRAPIFT